MALNQPNPNGQAASSASSPVVIASDQTTIKTKLANDITATSGTITTSTSTVTTGALSGVGSVTVGISGTYAGVNVTFEASLTGAAGTWVTLPATPLGNANPTSVLATGVLTSNSTNIYNVSPLLGATYFQVRATAYTSGTANVTIQPSAQFVSNNVNAVVTSAPTTLVAVNAGSNTIGSIANIGTSVTPGTAAANLGKAEDAAHASGDTGIFSLGVRNDGAGTTFTSANGDYSPIATSGQGDLHVVQKASTGTITSLASSTTTATILTANVNRKGGSIYNDSTAVLYIAFAASASTTAFTVPLGANTYYEIPGGYVGVISGVWASAAGNARITELT